MKHPDGDSDIALRLKYPDGYSDIALNLSQDVRGNLKESEVRKRLIEKIHEFTDHRYVEAGTIPVREVAGMIMSVWEHMDKEMIAA